MHIKQHTMIKPHGLTIVTDPLAGKIIEHDTFQCGHCGAHLEYKPGQKRPKCLNCMQYVCMKPLCLARCYPVENRLEDAEAGKIVMP